LGHRLARSTPEHNVPMLRPRRGPSGTVSSHPNPLLSLTSQSCYAGPVPWGGPGFLVTRRPVSGPDATQTPSSTHPPLRVSSGGRARHAVPVNVRLGPVTRPPRRPTPKLWRDRQVRQAL